MAAPNNRSASLARMVSDRGRAILQRVPTALERAADAMLADIKERTARGVGMNGRSFPEYSEGYARREKGGRRRPVTLKETGDMLRDLQVRRRGGKVVIGFSDRRQQDKARWLSLNQRKPRRFVGPTTRGARRSFEVFGAAVRVSLTSDRRESVKLTFMGR